MITEVTVARLLRTIDNRKVPEHDGVSTSLLKHCVEVLVGSLTHRHLAYPVERGTCHTCTQEER